MKAQGKFHVTPENAYGDFFSSRHIHSRFLSHNSLKIELGFTSTSTTIETVARCGENVIADISGGSVVRSYVTPMLDQNVSMTDVAASTTYYYNQDERQSVMNITDSTGAVAASYGYSAYGDPVDALTEGDIEQRYTYTGRELSDTTDDYYFRYRWYRGVSGNFLSRDREGYINGMSTYVGWFAEWLDTDPKGLWTNSKKYGCGHDTFTGHGGGWCLDYEKEDNSFWTTPINIFTGTFRHFKPFEDSERDILKALNECDRDKFQRAMHRMQDFFSHAHAGFSWPGTIGHIPQDKIEEWLRMEDGDIPPWMYQYLPENLLQLIGRRYGSADDCSRSPQSYFYRMAERRTVQWHTRLMFCCCKGKDCAGSEKDKNWSILKNRRWPKECTTPLPPLKIPPHPRVTCIKKCMWKVPGKRDKCFKECLLNETISLPGPNPYDVN